MANSLFKLVIAAAVVFGLALSVPNVRQPRGTIYIVKSSGDACDVYSDFVNKFMKEYDMRYGCDGRTADSKADIKARCGDSSIKNIKKFCNGSVNFVDAIDGPWTCTFTNYNDTKKNFTHCIEANGWGTCSRSSSFLLSPLSAVTLTLIACALGAHHSSSPL